MWSSIKPIRSIKTPIPKVDMMACLDSQDYSNDDSDEWNMMSFHLVAMYLKKLYQEKPVRQSRIDEVETSLARAVKTRILLSIDSNPHINRDIINGLNNIETMREISKQLVISGSFDRPF